MSVNGSSTVREPRPAAVAAGQGAAAARLQPPAYFRWKAAFDRAAAALLLLPGLPMIGILMALVRLTSRSGDLSPNAHRPGRPEIHDL